MALLQINRDIEEIAQNKLLITWTPSNKECKDIAVHQEIIDSMAELDTIEQSIKESILLCVNNYFETSDYELSQDIVPPNFYAKLQNDGRTAVNNLMRELLITATENSLPRAVNQMIEATYKQVTDDLLWGW